MGHTGEKRRNEGGTMKARIRHLRKLIPAVWTGASARDVAGPACLIDMVHGHP